MTDERIQRDIFGKLRMTKKNRTCERKCATFVKISIVCQTRIPTTFEYSLIESVCRVSYDSVRNKFTPEQLVVY